MQVDIAFDLVREVIDFEALGGGVGDEADRIAEAEGGKAELDRVRAQVAAEQHRRLVALELELARVPRLVQLPGVHEGADLGDRVSTRLPGRSRLEGHARDRRLLLDCSDRSHELIHVDAISPCHSRHQISSWPGLAGRIASYPFSDRSMRRPSVSTGYAARSASRCGIASGEGDRLRAGHDLFHHLGGTDDGHTFCQLVWVDAPRFRAGTAEPYLAVISEELTHQIAQLRQPVGFDAVTATFASQADGFDRAKDNRLLSRGGRDIRGDEGQRRPLRVFTAPGAVEDQLLVHFFLSTVMVRRPSSCASVDMTRCPSSLASEGRSSLAAGSLTTTSSDPPIGNLAIWLRNSCANPSAQPMAPASKTCTGPAAVAGSI